MPLLCRLQPEAGTEQRAIRGGRRGGADSAGPDQLHARAGARSAPVPRGALSKRKKEKEETTLTSIKLSGLQLLMQQSTVL